MAENQYMMFPSMPGYNATNIPGLTPMGPQTAAATGGGTNIGYDPKKTGQRPVSTDIAGGQYSAVSPLDPAFTKAYSGWLGSEIGKGVSPYPGGLTAPNNQILQMLTAMFEPGGSLASMIKTGEPISALPEWKAMVDASGQNVQRNLAQLREQFAAGGNLMGTPYGDATQNYMAQTTKDQNAMLIQAQTQALEQAMGRKLSADEFMGQFGQYLQGLDQASINRMYQEYIRTSPEYNPLINAMAQFATTYPPTVQKEQGGGILGGILGNLGPILNASSMIPGIGMAANTLGKLGDLAGKVRV